MIHVCFALYDKVGLFSKFTGTAMLSIFENHKPTPSRYSPSITVHILHDNTLSTDNREKFVYLAGLYNQIVKFYNVEKLCADQIEKIKKAFPKFNEKRYSVATFYRFLIPHVLTQEIEKIIYLDSDIIVNLDINELWQFELNDNVLAVVPNAFNNGKNSSDILCIDGLVKPKDYFNAGMLMINLKLMPNEQETIMNGINFIYKNPKYSEMNDQSVLNYCFSARSLKLPVKFNRLVKWARYFKVTQAEKMIYHYNSITSALGLGTDMNDPFNRLWMSYFIRTPWFNEDSIGRLCESYRNLRNDLMNARLVFYNRLAGKSRAFFIEPKKVESVKKIFSIRDDALIIPAENEESLQKLLDAMKASKDKCVFFIMPQKFLNKDFPFDMLTKAGFADNKDFVKGWYYLTEANGGTFNTNPFIRAM